MKALVALALVGCASGEAAIQPPVREARIPSAPGANAPSLVVVTGNPDGAQLADVDSCATCHPDVAAQWGSSAHSFASFGNPIYRYDVELVRAELGKPASKHCAGCHDMPLLVDGLMTSAQPIPADDLRAHSGVTCRLCHGVARTTYDGNGSYVLDATPLDAPTLGDAASIARHKQQVTTKIDTELCVGCHRGFLSPDMGIPVHLSGIDETGSWQSSAWTGNGMARIDRVAKKTCIDCHMERVAVSAAELGAKRGTVASHRFVGGHTWMAGMRGDTEQLRLTQAKLVGAASIDIAGARVIESSGSAGARSDAQRRGESIESSGSAGARSDAQRRGEAIESSGSAGARSDAQRRGESIESSGSAGARSDAQRRGESIEHGVAGAWQLPAERTPVKPGSRLELDVVIRNLLVGHRFPGGLLDVQDTWIELEVADRNGKRLAASGLAHAEDPDDDDAHVLHTLVVGEHGERLDEHELAQFRAQVATQTLGPREAQAVRYGFSVPAKVVLPLTVTARLRHRSRTLHMQAATCRAAQTAAGQAFIAGARGARDVELDPCRPQPITLVAETHLELGGKLTATRPVWERSYELGMALTSTIVTRLDEARAVLELAHAAAPDPRARAMVAVQLGWVASRQGRIDDALGSVREAREALGGAEPPVLEAIVADAYARANRWADAVAPAKSCAEGAPRNAAAWALYARVLVAVGDHEAALAAASRGLELSPRDNDLLRSQATALAALHDPRAEAAQAAYARFRSPDETAALRIRCATRSASCRRDRNPVHTLELH